VLLGTRSGLATSNVHKVTDGFVLGADPGLRRAQRLKWHWWRFNGYGFFAGMVAGTAAAWLEAGREHPPVFRFLLILAISSAASVLVCLWTKPERRRGAQELLPHGAAVGLLGADLTKMPGRGPDVRAQPRLPAGHVQHRGRIGVADPAW